MGCGDATGLSEVVVGVGMLPLWCPVFVGERKVEDKLLWEWLLCKAKTLHGSDALELIGKEEEEGVWNKQKNIFKYTLLITPVTVIVLWPYREIL